MTTLHYGCTALLGTNKAGVLKPDADGWYDMVLGALEYPNSVGDIYTLKSAREFFKEGSALLRRIQTGQLRAEWGHPMPQPGMDDKTYLTRILTIEPDRVCAHISDVYIDTQNVKDPKTGKTIIAFRGKVKPAGPFGQYLKEMLDDPKMNVAFSIRSLTMNRQVGFRQHKDFTQIVTWDYVIEPGLAPANKYSVPTLEHHLSSIDMNLPQTFNLDTVKSLAERHNRFGLESINLAKDIFNHIPTTRPASANW